MLMCDRPFVCARKALLSAARKRYSFKVKDNMVTPRAKKINQKGTTTPLPNGPMRFLVGCCTISTITAIQLTTRAPNKVSAAELHDFLARPIHWPQIVASSDRVANDNPRAPLVPGMMVDEYFGLGLLSVRWICRQSQPGTLLVVESPDGVPGIAKDCSMRFDIQENDVTLTMGYEPVSPLAILATPILVVDNWIALNVFLPAAIDPFPLDSFRKLMGGLYGVAGLLHALDLYVGDSILFQSNGIPPYSELPMEGKVLATIWCAMGPLAWRASRQASSKVKDAGLFAYALVEVMGAWASGHADVLGNALLVQGIVAGAWVYSSRKGRAKEPT